ncbi:MAG: group III truncated hemoglobin [Bacteroidota bacterium]
MTNAKKDLETRQDISFLVRTFYAKVRQDEMLGGIFNTIIQDWESHLEKLTDFWEGNLRLFTKTRFEGDPKTAHNQVDEAMNGTITMEHFGRWLNLWIETIDEHFEGETAQLAKNQARKMATFLYLKIFENRMQAQS